MSSYEPGFFRRAPRRRCLLFPWAGWTTLVLFTILVAPFLALVVLYLGTWLAPRRAASMALDKGAFNASGVVAGRGRFPVSSTDRNESAAPRRIVTIAPNAAEIICALSACDRIVGSCRFCTHPPQLRAGPRIGGFIDPDLERIVALRPDLIVLRGRNEAVERLCHDHGVQLYFDRTDTLDDIVRTTRDLGRLLRARDAAEALIGRMRERIERLQQRVAGRAKPRVFLVASRHPDRLANLLTSGPGTFLHETIEIAGGINVFGHLDMRYPQVSIESVIARRPDVILELMPEISAEGRAAADMQRKTPVGTATVMERAEESDDANLDAARQRRRSDDRNKPLGNVNRWPAEESSAKNGPSAGSPQVAFTEGTNTGETIEQRIRRQWSFYDSIPAVRRGRVYVLTDENALVPSPRYVAILEKVSRLLHPENGDRNADPLPERERGRRADTENGVER